MREKLFIASDHAAFWQKKFLIDKLSKSNEVLDLGTNSEDSVHYPHFAMKLVENLKTYQKELLENGEAKLARGILLCGTGIGVSMVANRYQGIRATLCKDEKEAELARKHNNSNVLCLGARTTPEDILWNITQAWLKTDFEGGRHQQRIDLFNDLGE